jgi:hypothetical protein
MRGTLLLVTGCLVAFPSVAEFQFGVSSTVTTPLWRARNNYTVSPGVAADLSYNLSENFRLGARLEYFHVLDGGDVEYTEDVYGNGVRQRLRRFFLVGRYRVDSEAPIVLNVHGGLGLMYASLEDLETWEYHSHTALGFRIGFQVLVKLWRGGVDFEMSFVEFPDGLFDWISRDRKSLPTLDISLGYAVPFGP